MRESPTLARRGGAPVAEIMVLREGEAVGLAELGWTEKFCRFRAR